MSDINEKFKGHAVEVPEPTQSTDSILQVCPDEKWWCSGGKSMCGKTEICRGVTWRAGYCLNPQARDKALLPKSP